MSKEEAYREKLVKFIKLNNAFYLFTDFDGHNIEQLEKIKNEIESDIKSEVQKRKIQLRNIINN